eukprot:6138297-Alexandrium_andersonii.AAC.1
MSASLVGSEMCIRDSLIRARAVIPGVSAARPCALGALRGPASGLPATVSYTHLTLPTICSV